MVKLVMKANVALQELTLNAPDALIVGWIYLKNAVTVLALFIIFMGYQVFQLEQEVKQLQTNSAVALLSAKAANKKVGAIALFFAQDKEAFVKAWLDSINMLLAVILEDVLIPLKRELEAKRLSKESQQQRTAVSP